MDRSNTGRVSFGIFAIWIVGVMLGIIPESIDQNSGYWWFFGLIVFAAAIRLFILFWQTLADAVQRRSLGWVFSHVIFGPLASIPYYLTAKSQPLSTTPTTAHVPEGQPMQITKPNKAAHTNPLPAPSRRLNEDYKP